MSLQNRITKIRNKINETSIRMRLSSNTQRWNKICASLDLVSDMYIAIEQYKGLSSFDAGSGGYLYLFGLWQTIYIQQDAIKSLSKALFDESLDLKNDYSELFALREIRNDIFGHPTDRNPDSSTHVISRVTITKGTFQVADHRGSRPAIRDIDVDKVIETQSEEVTKILVKIFNDLNS